MEIYIAAGSLAVLCLVYMGIRFYRHQCLLRDRAHLMREAVRNRDFTFRLPLRGLFFGERAMQEALNDLSRDINVLTAQAEGEVAVSHRLAHKVSTVA